MVYMLGALSTGACKFPFPLNDRLTSYIYIYIYSPLNMEVVGCV
jgi:hypothetical protein